VARVGQYDEPCARNHAGSRLTDGQIDHGMPLSPDTSTRVATPLTASG
jgi:hypothetical protein